MGVTNVLSVPFPYLRKGTVHVYVDGVEVPPNQVNWTSANTVQLPAPPSSYIGKTLRVQRFTPINQPEAVFAAGGLDQRDLNNVVLQALYVTQEAQDQTTILSVTLYARLAVEVARLDGTISDIAASPLVLSLPGLPTDLPPVPGKLWLNGGALAVS